MHILVTLVRNGWLQQIGGGKTVWVRGQAHADDEFLATGKLADAFLRVDSVSDFDALIQKLNGNWAVVLQTPTHLFFSVDHIRSIQLLYTWDANADECLVFDDIEWFKGAHTVEFDLSCAHEYLSSGYVYRGRTLFKGVYSLQAGERGAFFEKDLASGRTKLDLKRYWSWPAALPRKENAQHEDVVHVVDQCFVAAARRLTEIVGNRRVVVPLSGGYDSRIIVNYLHRLGFHNVLCYSYGLRGNLEAKYSEEVARRLGYEWHFVEYTSSNREKMISSPAMDEYYLFQANGGNRPCVQEFLALKTLKDQKIINPENDVIVPGYAFDLLAGSQIQKNTYKWNVVSNIHCINSLAYPRGVWRRVNSSISVSYQENRELGTNFVEAWVWLERCAKFVVNNVRSFEYLGFQWALPLWDKDLTQLWLSFQRRQRLERRLFRSVMPSLWEASLKDVPVLGNPAQGRVSLSGVKSDVCRRIPALWKYRLRQVVKSKPSTGEYVLGNVNLPDSCDRKILSEALPGIARRLEDNPQFGGGASENGYFPLHVLSLYVRQS